MPITKTENIVPVTTPTYHTRLFITEDRGVALRTVRIIGWQNEHHEPEADAYYKDSIDIIRPVPVGFNDLHRSFADEIWTADRTTEIEAIRRVVEHALLITALPDEDGEFDDKEQITAEIQKLHQQLARVGGTW